MDIHAHKKHTKNKEPQLKIFLFLLNSELKKHLFSYKMRMGEHKALQEWLVAI